MTQGLEIGQIALKFGANDLGSIMIEENVVVAGRHDLPHDRGRHAAVDPELGYEPHQRDNWYRLLN